MTRETSTEPPKPSKRKGTRSVSTLTPTQLARKRANDREAQRAIRQRTKEHIERLEKELEEYKNRHSRDETINQLQMRNHALEREVFSLREELKRFNHNMFSPPGFEAPDLLPAGHAGIPSRPPPFGQPSNDYNSAPQTFTFVPTTEEQWPSGVSVSSVPVSSVSVPSVVSSPCSSPSHPDEAFIPAYIPTSMPTMMEGNVITPTSMPCMDAAATKLEFEQRDIDPAADHGYPNPNVSQPAAGYITPQPWSATMYPSYYQPQPHGLPQAAGL